MSYRSESEGIRDIGDTKDVTHPLDNGFDAMFARFSRPDKFRMNGKPYPPGEEGLLEWARDFGDRRKKIVALDYTLWGERLSTVWLGLDHSFFGGEPLIFETMTFDEYRVTRVNPAKNLLSRFEITYRYTAWAFLIECFFFYRSEEDFTQIQERYHTVEQAREEHERIYCEMLCPPPLRRLVLGKWLGIGRWESGVSEA